MSIVEIYIKHLVSIRGSLTSNKIARRRNCTIRTSVGQSMAKLPVPVLIGEITAEGKRVRYESHHDPVALFDQFLAARRMCVDFRKLSCSLPNANCSDRWLDREPVSDQLAPIINFQGAVADRAVILTILPRHRPQFESTKASAAPGARYVARSHDLASR